MKLICCLMGLAQIWTWLEGAYKICCFELGWLYNVDIHGKFC